MFSVTGRIEYVEQPRGGFLNLKSFDVIQLDDNIILSKNENVNAGIVGMTVDYLTRLSTGKSIEQAFEYPLRGAKIINDEENAKSLLSEITGIDEKSVFAACKLVGYDVCYRAGVHKYKPVSEIIPNQETLENIIVMVNRCREFLHNNGPIVLEGFNFDGGYTKLVSKGDGDYLTKDTLWDFKVSRKEPYSVNTLQILMYYIMGKHSIHREFDDVSYIGIYNPRLNKIYKCPVSRIPDDVIEYVSHDIIGYGLTDEELRDFRIEHGLPDIEKAKLLLKRLYNSEIKTGDTVLHEKLGKGKVVSIRHIGKDTLYDIVFDENGTRSITSPFNGHHFIKKIETD